MASEASTTIDDFRDCLTGDDSPSIGASLDERTHFAHVRYAASDQAGVIWYDPRDGRERYNLDNDVDVVDVDPDDRPLLGVAIKPHRPESFGDPSTRYVIDRTLASIETLGRSAPGEESYEIQRVTSCVASQVCDSLEDAREWCRENVEGYSEAPRHDAVATRLYGGDPDGE